MTTPDLTDVIWRKSVRSSAQGGSCVGVVAVPWRKSTRSNPEGGDCIEVAVVVR